MTPKAGAKPSRLGARRLFCGVGKAALHCPREVKYSAGRFLFGQEENKSQPNEGLELTIFAWGEVLIASWPSASPADFL